MTSLLATALLFSSILTSYLGAEHPAWRTATRSLVEVREIEGVLVGPTSVVPLADTALIVFQSGRADPLLIDLATGHVKGQFVAGIDLLDSALVDENLRYVAYEIPDLKAELANGHFEWFESKRTTTYRPNYQNGCLVSDSEMVAITLIPLPSVVWRSSTRLEGIAQGMALVKINLPSGRVTGFDLLEVTDNCSCLSLGLFSVRDGFVVPSINGPAVSENRKDSLLVLSRVTTSGRHMPDRWFLPIDATRKYSWWDFASEWSTNGNRMVNVSSQGYCLLYSSRVNPGEIDVHRLRVPRDLTADSLAISFHRPIVIDSMLEVAALVVDTLKKDSIFTTTLFSLAEPSTNALQELPSAATDTITASQIGPGCQLRTSFHRALGGQYVRLFRKGDKWMIRKAMIERR